MQAQPRQLSEAEYAALLRFPFAEQADIIRAAQKDEYYKHVLNTNTFDVVRQALGLYRVCTSVVLTERRTSLGDELEGGNTLGSRDSVLPSYNTYWYDAEN